MSTSELRYDWTYSDYTRLPDDGNRYEVIDGELLVTPSPSPLHQRIVFRWRWRWRAMCNAAASAW